MEGKLRRFPAGWRLGTIVLSVLFLASTLLLGGCGSSQSTKTTNTAKPKIIFGDASWNSIQVHNRIAAFIVQHGYGYPVGFQFGNTIPTLEGLGKGDIDVLMEIWTENYQQAYDKLLKSGNVVDLGENYPDAPQGWYVPTYVIKGDPARGIKPMAPDLKSVSDLSKYWKLFRDPQDPSKGRFYNAPPGWAAATINTKQLKDFGLDKYYDAFSSGSGTALATSIVKAYEQGKPWLGYYWAPTWIMGKYKMTMLKMPTYNKAQWDKNYGCAYPASPVHKAINVKLEKTAPDVVTFLKKYHTTLTETNAFLAYMDNHKQGGTEGAAIWFLKNYPTVWKQWVPANVAAKVTQALNGVK